VTGESKRTLGAASPASTLKRYAPRRKDEGGGLQVDTERKLRPPSAEDRARAFADSEARLEQAKARLAAVDREVSLLLSRLKEIELGLDVEPLVE
jgi:hypothetical protein